MNAIVFIEKVRELRTAQKSFFKNRLKGDLVRSKQLEAEIDKALADGITVREFSEIDMTEEELQARLPFLQDPSLPDIDA